MRYRLHLATALPLDMLDAWFDMRRKTSQQNPDVDPNTSSMGTFFPHIGLKHDCGRRIKFKAVVIVNSHRSLMIGMIYSLAGLGSSPVE